MAFLSLLLLVVVLVGSPTGSGAAGPTKKRVIAACYSVDTGKIRVVKSIGACRAGEQHIRWVRGAEAKTSVGSRGPAGKAGATGKVGATGAVGPRGPAGAQGARGTQGATGPQGVAGPQGEPGDTGAAGADGAPGAVGPAGADGDAGADGAPGQTGPAGPRGPEGVQGARGETGPAGPAGPQGAQGPTGVLSFGYGRMQNATNLNPGSSNTVYFHSAQSASADVTVGVDHIAAPAGTYQVTLSARSESTNHAIWWVDTAAAYAPWPGSQLSFPAAASASAAVTGSVTFVATSTDALILRPRYVSGAQANFRDVQLSVIRLA